MTTTEYPEQSQAATALVLGIVALLLPILGPFAWYVGQGEVNAIDSGQRPPENRATAQTGRILGMITTAVVVLVGGFVVVFGLLAIINSS